MLLKKNYPVNYITQASDKILQCISENPLFKQAETVGLYYALPNEVQTADFIEKWYRKKNILLPVVDKDNISLQLYEGKDLLRPGSLGIFEPVTTIHDIIPELLIIPGIAFDLERNRLGRGKGYYDRLISDNSIPTIGICFHFQLFEQLPVEHHDQKMTLVMTEQEIIE